jgi:heat shock protein HslJ
MRSLAVRSRLWPAALLALAACVVGPSAGPGGEAERLEGTAWRLEELNGRPAVEAPGDGVPTLAFAADEPRASGNGGCNQFGGTYTRQRAALQFGALASTRRACVDEAANRQETAYLQALQSTTRYAIYDDLLVLYAGDQVVARLRRSGG